VIVTLVVLGGGLGAVARWLLTAWLGTSRHGFPVGTTAVNVVGSLLLGVVVGFDTSIGPSVADPVAIGLLGGFTTFSTWMVEVDRAGTSRDRGMIVLVPMTAGLVAATIGLGIGSLLATTS
jgi:CrcB protein